jgi:hypothetical protein
MAPSVGNAYIKINILDEYTVLAYYDMCVLSYIFTFLYHTHLPHVLVRRNKEDPAHIEDNSIFSEALKGQWREILV